MSQSTKEITRRIHSVASTKKITKAMELVAAAKMKKTVEKTLASRFYARYSWNILANLASLSYKVKYPLLQVREVKKIGVVLITSDRGLCGSYNTAIIKNLLEQLKNPHSLMINRYLDKRIEPTIDPKDLEIEFICLGKKGAEIIRKLNKKVAEVFVGFEDKPRLREIKPISQLIMTEYKNAVYDKVIVAYTDYFSVIKQKPKLRQLLPISRIDLEKVIKDLSLEFGEHEDEKRADQNKLVKDYLFEPSEEEVLKSILPKLVEMQLYQMILESIASEYSARMMAMKNASEAAEEMIEELTLVYNKARQSLITQEIAEISAGKTALEELA